LLVENAPDAIVVLYMESGKFSDCNEIALRLFRLTREELLCCGPSELSPPFQPDGGHSALAAREWMDRASSAQPYFGWTLRNSQREEIPCEVHVVRLPSTAHTLIRGSILDITERKRAEEALRESELRYRGLVNNATYGIYWVGLDGDLLDANPALVQMLGYGSIEELLAVDNTLCSFRNPAARDAVAERYREHERGDATVEWKRKNGKMITVRLIGRRSRDLRRNSPVTPPGETMPVTVEGSRPARGGAETILIAEDHEGLRELARETLANLGYDILLASDGEEAVRVFRANRDRVDLLLLDVVLPKINGPEAYAQISAEKEDVPAIFATAYSPEMALLHNALERGLTVLQKPYVPSELARRLRESLDRQPAKVHPG
jgi:PAS domain S-box-containing protein